MSLTFKQLKQGVCSRIASACPNSDEFLVKSNAAVRQLAQRGNWFGTISALNGCVYDNCITWPREVDTVLALNVCGYPSQMSNMWYRYVPIDESHRRDFIQYSRNGYAGNLMTSGNGNTPVFNNVPCGTNRWIQVFISNSLDSGKKITFYGIDSNGQIVNTQRADGTWQDGIELTLGNPFVQSSIQFRRVDRVVKDITSGMVRVYQFDGTVLYDMAQYQPTETTPDYVTSKIQGCRTGSCDGLTKISALVKLKHIDFFNDNDFVVVDCEDAIRDMMISIDRKEQGSIPDAQAMELSAFRELNYQSRNRWPIEQFSVDFRPFGSALLARKMQGFI